MITFGAGGLKIASNSTVYFVYLNSVVVCF